MQTYRVLMRQRGKSLIVARDVDLDMAYKIVDNLGKKTSRHFTIEKITYETFSVLTAREARLRLERGEASD